MSVISTLHQRSTSSYTYEEVEMVLASMLGSVLRVNAHGKHPTLDRRPLWKSPNPNALVPNS